MTTAVYVRVSSEMQLDGHSLDSQERICLDHCARHGLSVFRTYREEAESASSNDRPEFQRMLADVKAGLITAIVFYHTWRFTRNMDDAALMGRLERAGIRLISVTDAIDSATPSGKLQRNITLAVGQHYLDQLRVETTRGKQERALQQGRSNASKPPFGYVRDVEHQDVPSVEAPVVVEAFQRYATGAYTDRQIAEWLNSLGKTTTGNWGKRPFGKDTVRMILLNPFYVGKVGYRGLSARETQTGKRARVSKTNWKWVPGKHQPIVSPELFQTCMEVRKKRGRRYAGRKSNPSRVYLFGRLAVCSVCGRPLRSIRWGSHIDQAAYRCTSRERGLSCASRRVSLPEAALLGDTEAIITSFKLPEPVKAEAMRLLTKGDDSMAGERKRKTLEAQRGRLNYMFQTANITQEEYDAGIDKVKAELALIPKATRPVDATDAIKLLEDMQKLWEKAKPPERAEILRGLFVAIKVDIENRTIVGFQPRPEFASLMQALSNYGSDGI